MIFVRLDPSGSKAPPLLRHCSAAPGDGEPGSRIRLGSDEDHEAKRLATPILVVEDESMIAWMIEDILAEAGFRSIVLAPDAERARAAAERRTPGLLISDVNLGPGPDGIATALAIRAAAPAPLIFVTAYADEGLRARLAITFPGAQLLRKPVDPAALLAAVMRALADA